MRCINADLLAIASAIAEALLAATDSKLDYGADWVAVLCVFVCLCVWLYLCVLIRDELWLGSLWTPLVLQKYVLPAVANQTNGTT